jgi:hypothetical protein
MSTVVDVNDSTGFDAARLALARAVRRRCARDRHRTPINPHAVHVLYGLRRAGLTQY